jgi:hypothetical protein
MDVTDEKPDSGEKSAPAGQGILQRPYKSRAYAWRWGLGHDIIGLFRILMPALFKKMDQLRKPTIETEKYLLPHGKNTDKGVRVADIVAAVFMNGGRERPVMVLVEQQGHRASNFDLRVFQSIINLQASHPDRDVTALVIFTGKFQTSGSYTKTCFGTKLSVEYEPIHLSTYGIEKFRKDPSHLARIFEAGLLSEVKTIEEAEKNALQVLREMDRYRYDQEQQYHIIKSVKKLFCLDLNKDQLSKSFIEEFYMGYYESVKDFDLACEREEGRDEGRIEMIRKMLENNIPMATIIKVSEFPKEDILTIAKMMKKR